MPKNIMHVKKIQNKYFWDILINNKRFEIRKNDCNYKVGDRVKLVLHDGAKQVGQNNYIIVKITYILKDIPQYGLDADYCIFGFRICNKMIEN